MTEIGVLAGGAGQHDHSTLEVVPTQYYGKVAFNKNDKVAFVPCREHDKVVVPPKSYIAADYDQAQANRGPWSPQTPLALSRSAWDGDAGGLGGDVGTEKRERILGLKRWVAIVLGVTSLVAIGVAVGAGVGVLTRSRNNAEAEAAASQSVTATSAWRTSTSGSPTSSAPQSTAFRQVGGVGGRCSDNWGSDCICLDENVCAGTWNGIAKTGLRPNWPCPNDPVNIKGCYVQPCRGASQPSSRCLWREGCVEADPGK
ncbi:hypothetical protein C8A03DRAFT_39542 [Achaetomium macrosporum]|uniref:Uncharacterized protein n=1 Tax=Achaetomium macrosporum TaxID=79813 RepID=A0AAN7H8V3_9PEZI|nr:hypothetical protein C8A03DRAFT_39542 [Achaetomium macrosporum]